MSHVGEAMSDLDLAGAVRWLQANKVPDKNGLQWDQWVGKHACGKLGVLKDPARRRISDFQPSIRRAVRCFDILG